MSQFYLNGPSVGRSVPAEEFAAAPVQGPGPQPCPPPVNGCGCSSPAPKPPSCDCGCDCDCGRDCPADGCGQAGQCCQQMICCCRPAPGPAPKPPQVEEGCCCKQSFRAALGLLCDQQISSLLDFDAAAFITNTYTAGAALEGCKPSAGTAAGSAAQAEADADAGAGTMGRPNPNPPPKPCPGGQSDNLGTLEGSFKRFSPCSCDLLEIDAELYTAGGGCCSFTAGQVSLCELDAVVIQAAKGCPEGELTAAEVTARNFRCVRQRLAQQLNPCGGCGQDWCSCACDGRDCCCAAGLLATLAQNNLSRRVSLAAGLLLLQNVTLLGTVGNVLVLANDTEKRLYFVCVNSVQFIG